MRPGGGGGGVAASMRPGGVAASMRPGGGGGTPLVELAAAAPTQLLSEGLQELSDQLRSHLRRQETNLPEVMIHRFGAAAAGAPAMLVQRIIEASRGALPPGALAPEQLPPLLTWAYFYLRQRDAPRAARFAQHLPKPTRRRLSRLDSFLARDESHADRLQQLRAVEAARDPGRPGALSAPFKRRPRGASETSARSHRSESAGSGRSRRSASEASPAKSPSLTSRDSTEIRAKNRQAALVGSALTAANANRNRTALPNDETRDKIREVAQQEPILDWTPEAAWADGLKIGADRAEQIAKDINSKGAHKR